MELEQSAWAQAYRELRNSPGRMSSDQKPSRNRSSGRRLGARCRFRVRMRSCCLMSIFSATRALVPPGVRNRATAVRRWARSITSSFIYLSLGRRIDWGKIAKSLISCQYRNSPRTPLWWSLITNRVTRSLTLESNNHYNIDGVGFRNLGSLRDFPDGKAPQRWWMHPKTPTWQDIRSTYPERKQCALKVKNPHWAFQED